MFKKVVWATDGSEAADRALPLARTLAADGGGELLVVHCIELSQPGMWAARRPIRSDEKELKLKMDGQLAELAHDGVPATLQTMQASMGRAAEAIAEIAREQHGEVIVLASHGHTALGELVLGSVTQRLLRIAPCPVLAVPVNGVHAAA